MNLHKPKQKSVLINLDQDLVLKIDAETKRLGVTRKRFIEFCINEFFRSQTKESK